MERRSHPRVKVTHPVLYISQIYPRPNVASTLDLSLGGTKIQSLYTLNRDEGLEITIAIRSRVIKCRGRVVHAVELKRWKTEAGIKFEELPTHDENYLRQYLSQIMDDHTERIAQAG
jgi:c-di-GMP-binding flagellar brake protein YcgR